MAARTQYQHWSTVLLCSHSQSMPTFAILGATGTTGQAILTLLEKDPTAKIHCFVRNARKLYGQTPHLDLRTNKRVNVFEAPLTDIAALATCIAPCDAVFMCVATNENSPGCSIALDAAHSVVAALSHIRCVQKSEAPLPRIVVLSSGTINDHLCRETPAIAWWLVWIGLKYIYEDLIKAEAYYRLHKSWITVVFVQPGGLVEDVQAGHAVSTEKESTGFLSFLDLAAGMIECGMKDRSATEWDWLGVSVLPTGNTRFNFMAPVAILKGCVWTALPSLYWAFHWAKLV